MTLPNLERKDLKLFANDAAAQDNIAVFGSLASANPQFSKDIEAIQNLPAFLQGWAGAITGDASPALEDFNALFYVLFYQMAYLFQKGVAQWKATTDYYKGSFTTDGNGQIYSSIVDNNVGNDPATDDGTHWAKFPTPAEVASKVAKSGDTMSGQLVMNDTSGGIKLEGSVVPNPAGIDADTLAVWHFDGTQADVISGLLFNNNFPTPVFDTGIYKFGTASLKNRDSNVNPFYSSSLFTDRDWTATDWTIDGWVFYKNSKSRISLGPLSGSSTVSGTGLRINASELYVYVNSKLVHYLYIPFQNNSWNHLAFQKKGNTLSAYLNGEEVWSDDSLILRNNDFGLSVLDSFNVLLDELRISSMARYSGSFVPNTEPYSADAQPLPATSAIIDYSNERLNLLGEKTGKGVYLDGGNNGIPVYTDGTNAYRLLTTADFSNAVAYPNFNAPVNISLAQKVEYITPQNGWVAFSRNVYDAGGIEVYFNSILVYKSVTAARDGRDSINYCGMFLPVQANIKVTFSSSAQAFTVLTFYPNL